MSAARTHMMLAGLTLACTIACSLRSLDRLDSASAAGSVDGGGGTRAGAGGSSVGGTFSNGGSVVGGTSSTGGVDPAGGSDATGGSDAMGGSDAVGGTPANGGTSGGGARGGSAGAGSGSGGASSGAGGMGGLAGSSSGGGSGMAGGSSCDPPGSCPLRDETPYLLKPGHQPAKCADVQGFGVDNGTPVQQFTCFSQANEVFWAEDHGSGRYALRNALSGKCLQAEGASMTAGAAIRTASCSGALHQLWRPVPEGGRFRLFAEHSGLVLDVSGDAPTNDGVPLVQSPPDDFLDSSWLFEENSAGAFVVLSVPEQTGTRAVRQDEEIRVQTTTGPEAEWKVLPGLGNNACVSFESPAEPGRFLRHSGEEMRFEPNDATTEFAADATFCYRAPFAGTDWVFHALESHNQPGHYVARESDTVVLVPFVESSAFRAAATWAIRDP